ncbi:uncharacterized protein PSFLO_02748 [Pseudozyma flocculosa]|uniref:Uncharacterized protein n=1 Tax=Pseudozyma flocculosa TaxID=84751 RepID=A0A5C3F063_9BASI|nr:uncharacterized protein PSFLO_02748 [Pseudozyma flocculosa]
MSSAPPRPSVDAETMLKRADDAASKHGQRALKLILAPNRAFDPRRIAHGILRRLCLDLDTPDRRVGPVLLQ